MTAPRMRSDLRPLCDIHLDRTMVSDKITIQWPPMFSELVPDQLDKQVYRCTVDGCGHYYHPLQRYFFVSSQRKLQVVRREPCPSEAFAAMYFSELNQQTKVQTWKCGNLGCSGIKAI